MQKTLENYAKLKMAYDSDLTHQIRSLLKRKAWPKAKFLGFDLRKLKKA